MKAIFGEQESQLEVQERRSFTPGYRGPERRQMDRRQNAERRKLVRFDVTRQDRRRGTGRRSEDGNVSYY